MGDQSDKFTMNRDDWENWLHNAKLFTVPVITLYLTTVLGTISQDGHVFSITDLYLTKFMQGGIAIYVLSSLLDWVRKWSSGY